MAQTVNLATKYAARVQQEFTRESVLEGRSKNQVEFTGAKTVKITTIGTVPIHDYNRNASANRYGTPEEVPDIVQELTMSQDKSFTGIIDAGNSVQQTINKAGKFMRVQTDSKIIPYKDKYGLNVLAHKAGTIHGDATALTKDNIVARLQAAQTAIENAGANMSDCVWYVKSTVANLIAQVEMFTSNEKLVNQSLVKGQVGEILGAPVIKPRDALMPADVNFMLVNGYSFTSPCQLNSLKAHKDPPGINGDLIEGRFICDTFVIGAKAMGIYVDTSVEPPAAPAITASSGSVTVASGYSAVVTLDGSDPRYSASAQVLSATGAPAGVASGDVIRAATYKSDGTGWISAVAEATKS